MWQAILKGRAALELGLVRRIGDGQSTNIWQDRWIPGVPGCKPISKKRSATATKVSELLNSEGSAWDVQKLNNNMNPLEANEIMKIPIGKLQEDLWAWNGENHGLYTVKSAYRLLASSARYEEHYRKGIAGNSETDGNKIWFKLWRLAVPPKIRTFWWRVIHGFIPAREVLLQRHIEKQGENHTSM